MQKLSPIYLEFPFGAADTAKTFTIPENGWAKVVVIQNPTFTNTVTSVLTIVDPVPFIANRSVALFTSATVVNGATYIVGDDITAAERADIPLDKTYQATITLSGVPGGTGGTVFVALYLKH
jgi:ribose/xylose/arabinose/galactoside ABC-type transport system permease subunit